MNLQHTQIYRFLLNVQTEYEYEGWNTFEWKSPCTCKTRYDSSRHNITHRNQRKVWTNNIHFRRVYIYIWKGLESTEYLLRWSGSQNKRTHEREWESTIPYRSSQQWPRATLTFTAEWTKLWPKQQRSRCRRSQIQWSVSEYAGGKIRFVTKVQAWQRLESWGTSDALGGLVEHQKDIPPRLPETSSLPPANMPPPPPQAGEKDAAASRQTLPSSPFCLPQLAQGESQRFTSSSAAHSSRHTFLTSSGFTTEGKILAGECFRSHESSGESGWILLLWSLSGRLPLTSTADWHCCKETLPK